MKSRVWPFSPDARFALREPHSQLATATPIYVDRILTPDYEAMEQSENTFVTKLHHQSCRSVALAPKVWCQNTVVGD
jgi:hypothetical protein